jgi:hypothetical protein
MSAWISHVRSYRTANPQLTYKQAMQASKDSYVSTAKPKVVKMRGGCHTDSDGEMVPCKKMKGKGYMKPIRGAGFPSFMQTLSEQTGKKYTAVEKKMIKQHIQKQFMTGSGKKADSAALFFLGKDRLPAQGEPGASGDFWTDFGYGFSNTFKTGVKGIKKGAGVVASIATLLGQPELAVPAGMVAGVAGIADSALS